MALLWLTPRRIACSNILTAAGEPFWDAYLWRSHPGVIKHGKSAISWHVWICGKSSNDGWGMEPMDVPCLISRAHQIWKCDDWIFLRGTPDGTGIGTDSPWGAHQWCHPLLGASLLGVPRRILPAKRSKKSALFGACSHFMPFYAILCKDNRDNPMILWPQGTHQPWTLGFYRLVPDARRGLGPHHKGPPRLEVGTLRSPELPSGGCQVRKVEGFTMSM